MFTKQRVCHYILPVPRLFLFCIILFQFILFHYIILFYSIFLHLRSHHSVCFHSGFTFLINQLPLCLETMSKS